MADKFREKIYAEKTGKIFLKKREKLPKTEKKQRKKQGKYSYEKLKKKMA